MNFTSMLVWLSWRARSDDTVLIHWVMAPVLTVTGYALDELYLDACMACATGHCQHKQVSRSVCWEKALVLAVVSELGPGVGR